jgi:hypothetical protein
LEAAIMPAAKSRATNTSGRCRRKMEDPEMTVMTDLNAVNLTGAAKSSSLAKGADLAALVTQAKLHVIELRTILQNIVALHPVGDAGIAALNSVIAELA